MESSAFIINNMSCSEILKEFNFLLVPYVKGGNTLEFFIGVQIDAKKSLKRFAFTLKSDTKLPLISNGGIAGIVFGEVFESSSFLDIARM